MFLKNKMQEIDEFESFPDNLKDQIEGLEKWFTDHFSKSNENQKSIVDFVQMKIRKIKADSLAKKSRQLEDPQINQEIINNPLHVYNGLLLIFCFLNNKVI